MYLNFTIFKELRKLSRAEKFAGINLFIYSFSSNFKEIITVPY